VTNSLYPELEVWFALLRGEWGVVDQYLYENPPETNIPTLLHRRCPEKAGIALSLATSKYLHTDNLGQAQTLWQSIMQSIYSLSPELAEQFEDRWTTSIVAYCRENNLPCIREDYGFL